MLNKKINYLLITLIFGVFISFAQLCNAAVQHPSIKDANSDNVSQICIDSKDNVYVGELLGGFWASYDHGATYAVHNTSLGYIWGMTVYHNKQTNKDTIYILTPGNVAPGKLEANPVVYISTDQGQHFTSIEIPYVMNPHGIAVDSKGRIYVANADYISSSIGLVIIDNGKFKVINHANNKLLTDRNMEVYVDNKDRVYVLSMNYYPEQSFGGLSVSSNGGDSFDITTDMRKIAEIWDQGSLIVTADDSGNSNVYVIGRWVDQELHISNDGGRSFTEKHPPIGWAARLYVDQSNNIYLAGGNQLNDPLVLISSDGGNNFVTYSKKDGLDGDVADPITVDTHGNIFTAGGDEGEYILIGKKDAKGKYAFTKSYLKVSK